MANYLLNFYGILGAVGGELEAACDQAAYEDDNGQTVSVAEARPPALALLDDHLRRLQELREDVARLSVKKLEAKWGGGGDDY